MLPYGDGCVTKLTSSGEVTGTPELTRLLHAPARLARENVSAPPVITVYALKFVLVTRLQIRRLILRFNASNFGCTYSRWRSSAVRTLSQERIVKLTEGGWSRTMATVAWSVSLVLIGP